MAHRPAWLSIAAKYNYWDSMRDDLAPLRHQLPPDVTRLGYAGKFLDTSYGLWKPLGRRVVVELGLSLGAKPPPPAGLEYAVVTVRGLQERYGMSLPAWLEFARAEIVFEMERNTSLTGTHPAYEIWYLVRFRR